MLIPKWPKMHALGHRYNRDIFECEYLEVTEKLDGSQFKFGLMNDCLIIQSKGAVLDQDNPDKLFAPAVKYVQRLHEVQFLPEGLMFYSETLCRPKHNVLAYERVPLNHIALFGGFDAVTDSWFTHCELTEWAKTLQIDVVPLLCEQKVADIEALLPFLEKQSFLGGSKIEGFVMKDYSRDYYVGDQYFPLKSAKFVSEEFKEVAQKKRPSFSTKLKWEDIKESYRTEARWDKAIQHLREAGRLTGEPKDIGALVSEVKRDIAEEERDNILDKLWKLYGNDLLRHAARGLPEYYKLKLAKGEIDAT